MKSTYLWAKFIGSNENVNAGLLKKRPPARWSAAAQGLMGFERSLGKPKELVEPPLQAQAIVRR